MFHSLANSFDKLSTVYFELPQEMYIRMEKHGGWIFRQVRRYGRWYIERKFVTIHVLTMVR